MSLLSKWSTPEIRQALEVITFQARRLETRVWLVGGAVRDMLLGTKTTDLDFAVSGDAARLAEAVAEKLDGSVSRHDRFLTASVSSEHLLLDFNTLRREHYERPGALPTVSPGTLESDLARRDFTINAMAIDLEEPGTLIDLHEGKADLDQGLIRVLHPGSFTDDPTRIDRALRFAGRLGFELESQTEALVGEAIASGAREAVSPERIAAELRLVLSEKHAAAILERLAAPGALKPIGLGPITARRAAAVARVAQARGRFDRQVTIAALASSTSELESFANAFEFSFKRMRNARYALESVERGNLPSRDLSRPEIEVALRALRDEGLADYLTALEVYHDTRLPFSGDQVHDQAGPHLARAIDAARQAVAWGELRPSESLGFARRVALGYLSGK